MVTRIYDLVTARVLEALSKGVVPWRKPWHTKPQPANAATGKSYRGVNLLLLGLADHGDHRWLTIKQANELGGTVRRGETASLVVFWKRWEPSTQDEEESTRKRSIPVLRYYHVFNVEQCESVRLEPLPEREQPSEEQRIAAAECLVRSMPDPPTIEEKGEAAWYSPLDDRVRVPPFSVFRAVEHFYGTLFHELGHATGHQKRLARKGVMDRILFGSEEYSREELVAELTSAFCCSAVGLDNSLTDNSASYVCSWLKALEDDPKAVVLAASQAQRAADYIRGMNHGGVIEA